MHAACQAGHWALAILLLGLPCCGCQADPTVTLRVRLLHAAGGEGGVERDLPARLTTALAHFLHDHADPTLHIETGGGSQQSTARLLMARYTLESDLSYASGPDAESGRYLLVARLIREGRPSALVGQWAGAAVSLRYLTANLRNDPRVHTLGLVGEIGSRVLAGVAIDTAAPDQRWHALLAQLTPLRSPKISLIQAETPYSGRFEIAGDAAFRLRFQTSTTPPSYLVTSGGGSRWEALPLSLTGPAASPPRSVQTDSQPLRLPGGTREAWLLCRSVPAAHETTALRPHGRLSRACKSLTDEDDAPVHVVNGVGKGVPSPQETLPPLLAEIARAPQSWRVLRLRVTFVHK